MKPSSSGYKLLYFSHRFDCPIVLIKKGRLSLDGFSWNFVFHALLKFSNFLSNKFKVIGVLEEDLTQTFTSSILTEISYAILADTSTLKKRTTKNAKLTLLFDHFWTRPNNINTFSCHYARFSSFLEVVLHWDSRCCGMSHSVDWYLPAFRNNLLVPSASVKHSKKNFGMLFHETLWNSTSGA